MHISSGRCGECAKHSRKDCDVKITEGEWVRLKRTRARLLERQVEAQAATTAAMKKEIEAREATAKAVSTEARLLKELELLEKRGAEMISVGEREAVSEMFLDDIGDSGMALTPTTWSACDGLTDDMWMTGPDDTPFTSDGVLLLS